MPTHRTRTEHAYFGISQQKFQVIMLSMLECIKTNTPLIIVTHHSSSYFTATVSKKNFTKLKFLQNCLNKKKKRISIRD